MADPVVRLLEASRKVAGKADVLLRATDPLEFDRLFTEMEPDILAWKDAFNSVDKTNVAQMNAVIRVAQTVLPVLGQIHQKSVDLGATKGQRPMTAPAAGGFKMPRKYSRKYCKKTPCKKMGFTQRSSCRPYKNCFTRRRGRRSA